jgi:hypothetical protein
MTLQLFLVHEENLIFFLTSVHNLHTQHEEPFGSQKLKATLVSLILFSEWLSSHIFWGRTLILLQKKLRYK